MLKSIRIVGITAVMLLLSIGAARSQSFEGTISMEITSSKVSKMDSVFGLKADNNRTILDISFKGTKFVAHSKSPTGTMDVYGDFAVHTVIIWMNQAKKAMQLPLKDPNYVTKINHGDPTAVIAANRHKQINGIESDLYTLSSVKSGESNWWMTSDLPKKLREPLEEAFDQSGGAAKTPSRNNYYGNSTLESLLTKGLLPVRMEAMHDGKVESTITFIKYEEKKMDDSMFAVPSEVEVVPMGGK